MNTNLKQVLAVTVLAATALIACKEEAKKDTATIEKIPGIVLENMDTTVSPKEDFYNYVNGNWMKTTKIPEDQATWGGFMVLRKSTRNDVLEIVKTSKELGSYADGTDQKKALLFFESELDTVARNEAGLQPLKPLLEAIDGITSIKDMQTVYAKTLGVDAPFFNLNVFPDLNDSKMNATYITKGGI